MAHAEQEPCSRTVILGNKPVCLDLPKIHFFLWRAITSSSNRGGLIVFFEKDGVITYSGFPNCNSGSMCTGNDIIPFKDSVSEQLKNLVSYFWQSRFDPTSYDCSIGRQFAPSWWTAILIKVINGELEDYRVRDDL